MIITFKLFEELDQNQPKIGDYVLATNKYWSEKQNHFFLSKIGKIISISKSQGKNLYNVKYNEEFFIMPRRKFDFGENSTVFWKNEIIHWSENIEDLIPFVELYNDMLKYNL